MNKKIIIIVIMMFLAKPIFSVNAIINVDESPSAPDITGPCDAKLGKMCNYTIISTDPQGDNIFYEIRYSDDPTARIEIGPYLSGISVIINHCWCTQYQNYNPFFINVRARDVDGHTSNWSTFKTNITDLDKIKTKTYIDVILLFLQKLFQHFPLFEKILKQII